MPRQVHEADPANLAALRDRAALTMAETARSLGVSETTIWRLVKNGALDSCKIGGRRMILRAALDRYLAALDGGTGAH